MNDAEMLTMAGKRLHHGQCATASERPVYPELGGEVGINADNAVPHYLRDLSTLM